MIKFLDLQAQYQVIKPEIDEALQDVLDNSSYILGPRVTDCENKFAALCDVKHAIGVNTGTSALHLSLLAHDIGPGDEVITVPLTFVATVAAIMYVGAKPVLVDVEPDFYTMDPEKVEQAITSRTKAIMPVHLYGQTADMGAIMALGEKYGIPVIEDACQAHCAEYHGRRAGSIGAVGCFSFYPGKNLGAYGEGGMVVTNDDRIADKVKMLRDWGQRDKGVHECLGYNYRLEGFQGAVVGVKAKYIEQWSEGRRSRAALYADCLSGHGVAVPKVRSGCEHVYHVYAVLVDQREKVQEALASDGVQTGVHYKLPVHLQPGYSQLGYGKGDLPIAEKVASQTLSLPMYPELKDEEVEVVSERLALALKAL